MRKANLRKDRRGKAPVLHVLGDVLVSGGVEHHHAVVLAALLAHETHKNRGQLSLQFQEPLCESGRSLHNPPLIRCLDLEIVAKRTAECRHAKSTRTRGRATAGGRMHSCHDAWP